MFNELNPKQQEAVTYNSGPLIIIAGPGTGKTRTLIAKINFLINKLDVSPKEILALTFTTKAVKEIKDRLDNLSVNISTFHALAFSLLDKNKDIKIISSKDKRKLLRDLRKSYPDLKGFNINEIELLVSKSKVQNILSKNECLADYINFYQDQLKKINKLDYDDLIINAYNSLKTNTLNPNLSTPKFLLIDEFQDTNKLQYELVKLLLNKNSKTTVIGDPFQSIYGFRGARGDAFKQFSNDYPDSKTITLKTNYRSTPKIIATFSNLYSNKSLQESFSKTSGKVQLINTLNKFTEADWILTKISQIIGGMDLNESSDLSTLPSDQKVQFKDFAVIYRLHGLNRVLEKKFSAAGIPFQIVGGKSIYESSEVKFITDLFKFFKEKNDNTLKDLLISQFINIPENNIEKLVELRNGESLWNTLLKTFDQKHFSRKTSEILSSFISKILEIENSQLKFSELYNTIFEKFSLHNLPTEKLSNLNRFKSLMTRLDKVDPKNLISKFNQEIKNIEEKGYFDENANVISLLTIHASKGLEFKYVFLIGFEDGLIPFTKKETDLEEEKRLLYVALSRAKEGLYILKTITRNREKTKKSQFENKLNLSEENDPIISRISKKRRILKEKKSQMGMFK